LNAEKQPQILRCVQDDSDVRAAAQQKSELYAQLAVCHCGFQDLGFQIFVLLGSACVHIECVCMPWANYAAFFNNSLPQRSSFVGTRAIEDRNGPADVGNAQRTALNGKLGNFAFGRQFRFRTDANKLGHDESSLSYGRRYRPAPLA
jgi:hypothetical protein